MEDNMARDPEHILSACGILTPQSYRWLGHPRPVIGLYLGLADKYVPPGENLAMSRTFLNQFVKADGNYRWRISGHRVGYTPTKSSGGVSWLPTSWTNSVVNWRGWGSMRLLEPPAMEYKSACQTTMPSYTYTAHPPGYSLFLSGVGTGSTRDVKNIEAPWLRQVNNKERVKVRKS